MSVTTLLGVRELVTALFAKFISRDYLSWDGINSVIKGGNQSSPRGYARHGKLPHFLLRQGYGGQAMCESRNSQKMKLENKC